MAATDSVISANRKNAQASTGPRTPEGKQRSAMNAIRIGLFSESPVLPGEDPADYDAFRAEFTLDLDPKGIVEDTCADTIVSTQWRLKRCTGIEQSILASDELDAAQKIDAIARFSLYEGRLASKFHQTLKEFRLAQAERKARDEAQMKEAIEVAAECKAANRPFDPARFGFVFSAAEIQIRLHRRERLQAAELRQTARQPASSKRVPETSAKL